MRSLEPAVCPSLSLTCHLPSLWFLTFTLALLGLTKWRNAIRDCEISQVLAVSLLILQRFIWGKEGWGLVRGAFQPRKRAYCKPTKPLSAFLLPSIRSPTFPRMPSNANCGRPDRPSGMWGSSAKRRLTISVHPSCHCPSKDHSVLRLFWTLSKNNWRN